MYILDYIGPNSAPFLNEDLTGGIALCLIYWHVSIATCIYLNVLNWNEHNTGYLLNINLYAIGVLCCVHFSSERNDNL